MHAPLREEAWLELARHDPDQLAALLQADPTLVNRLAEPEAVAEALGQAGYGPLCLEIAFSASVHRHATIVFRDHAGE